MLLVKMLFYQNTQMNLEIWCSHDIYQQGLTASLVLGPYLSIIILGFYLCLVQLSIISCLLCVQA